MILARPRPRTCPSGIETGVGGYDRLYVVAGLLWPSRPGRMVARAVKIVPPGSSLDLGCGDGKNVVFLRKHGWRVDAVDVSAVAIQAARLRLLAAGMTDQQVLRCEDVVRMNFGGSTYDLVVAYGLYHCLDDARVAEAHSRAVRALKPGGLFAYAAFTDELPLPADHQTGRLHLRPRDHVERLFPGWDTVDVQFGTIREAHPPLVGLHEHSLAWALMRKPT